MLPTPCVCPNYEVVFSGAEVLLTFEANDVTFLSSGEEQADSAKQDGSTASGNTASRGLTPGPDPRAVATEVELHDAQEGAEGSVSARFGELGRVSFPALPLSVAEAIQAAGKLWIVALDGEGTVVGEAQLPLR